MGQNNKFAAEKKQRLPNIYVVMTLSLRFRTAWILLISMFLLIQSAPKAVAQDAGSSSTEMSQTTSDGGASDDGVVKEAPVKKYTNYVLIALAVLFVIIVAQLFGTISLLGEIRGKQLIDWSKFNPLLMLMFLVVGLTSVLYEFSEHGRLMLPEPATEHGAKIDKMWDTTTIFILIVFFITQVLLFWFVFRYRARKGHTAYFYPHNNKLEYIWTLIPAVVLTILILDGLKTWNGITTKAPEDAQVVEIYAYQFGWTARYPGADKQLGHHNFRMISADNDLGVDWNDPKSHDDIYSKEIHLVVGKPVEFKFRAKDVIHSAYLPYFRTQMNVVPGVPTSFWFVPTKTNAEMREILRAEGREKTDKWDYYLFCNKICGAAHYNMKIKVVVESQADYDKWLKDQKSQYASIMEANNPQPQPTGETAPAPADTTKKQEPKPTASIN